MKLFIVLSIIVGLSYVASDNSQNFDIPPEVIDDALESGAISAYLFGTFEERHAFAKGQSTRFGHMSFDSDSYLQSKCWNEHKIHEAGNYYGFSGKR